MFLLATMHEMQARSKVNSYSNAPILNNKMQFALRYSIEPTSIICNLDDIMLKKKTQTANYFCSIIQLISSTGNVRNKKMKVVIISCFFLMKA